MTKKPRIPKHLAALFGLAASTTVAGCATALYGVPAMDDDNDGYYTPSDCNDADANINPAADDPEGDGIDQNCDGVDGDATDTGS